MGYMSPNSYQHYLASWPGKLLRSCGEPHLEQAADALQLSCPQAMMLQHGLQAGVTACTDLPCCTLLRAAAGTGCWLQIVQRCRQVLQHLLHLPTAAAGACTAAVLGDRNARCCRCTLTRMHCLDAWAAGKSGSQRAQQIPAGSWACFSAFCLHLCRLPACLCVRP